MSIPKAADLPVGTVVATEDLVGIRMDIGPRYAEWWMSNGGRYHDVHIDKMLAEGAQVLRVGTHQPTTAELEPATPGSRVYARLADAYNPPGPHRLWVLITDPAHGPAWRSESTGYETTWRNLLEVRVEHVAPAVRPMRVAAGEVVDPDDFTQHADEAHTPADVASLTRDRRKRGMSGGLLPCGCLPNDADAHRVGCPRYPEGRRGDR